MRRPQVGASRIGSFSDSTSSSSPRAFFSPLSHGGCVGNASPHGQEEPATVDDRKGSGQVRQSGTPPHEVPSRLPIWSSGPGLSLMAVLKLITGRGKETPMIGLIQS